MNRLMATWAPRGSLFFWSPDADPVVAMERVFGRSWSDRGAVRSLVTPGGGSTFEVHGVEVGVAEMVPDLSVVEGDADVSDSLACWVAATKLGLELAARHRVLPSVGEGRATWRALLTRRQDRERFDAISDALPPCARATPVEVASHGPGLPSRAAVVRAFLDAVVDHTYRTGAWPGPGRGWVLELSEALRGDTRSFSPREARHQSVPALLAAWAAEADAADVRVGFELELPRSGDERFWVRSFLHPVGAPTQRIAVTEAWAQEGAVRIGGAQFGRCSYLAVRGLARAIRIHPDLSPMLEGGRPRDVSVSPAAVWRFLSRGVPELSAAGFEVVVPAAFANAGHRRVRAQMRMVGDGHGDGFLDLERGLEFRWEVTLGDLVLEGSAFAEITASGEPVVWFRGQWVLLDPAELARLPEGLRRGGRLSTAEALRAMLSGEHEGIPVVADDRLGLVLEALRHPPEHAPPAGLTAALRPYQRHGYNWLATLGALGLGCCLADDMGLGKTVQLIAHVSRRIELCDPESRRPTLIVCPTSVLGNWARELGRFAPGVQVRRYHGLERGADATWGADVVLTTYGLLVRDAEALSAIEWDCAVLDEAQSIKNPDSQRARAARALRARHRIALTGTPVENRLEELWSLMAFLVPGLLGPRAAFLRNVAVPIERFGDERVARALRLGVGPFLLRRLKSDPEIAPDLPDKIERMVLAALTREQASLYRKITEESLEDIAAADSIQRRGRVLAMLTALKQVCNHPEHYLREGGPLPHRSGKLERCIEILDAVTENGERALVFTQYREMGLLLQRHIEDRLGAPVPFLHGGTPPEVRDAMVAAFQEDSEGSSVLLVSLRAGGTGLNLTRATHVIHFDRWWNPAVEDQATDRAYRIGQARNVLVHKLVCQGTLEERVDALLREKRALAETVVGGGDNWVTELDEDALRRLVSLTEDAHEES